MYQALHHGLLCYTPHPYPMPMKAGMIMLSLVAYFNPMFTILPLIFLSRAHTCLPFTLHYSLLLCSHSYRKSPINSLLPLFFFRQNLQTFWFSALTLYGFAKSVTCSHVLLNNNIIILLLPRLSTIQCKLNFFKLL